MLDDALQELSNDLHKMQHRLVDAMTHHEEQMRILQAELHSTQLRLDAVVDRIRDSGSRETITAMVRR